MVAVPTFTPRPYQETIAQGCLLRNTLVVLPTGLGKTNIFLLAALHRITIYPNGKILLLGPTKPLIDQYAAAFLRHSTFSEDQLVVFTGDVPPDKRLALWKDKTVIFSTPQCIENDVLSGKLSLQDVCLLGFDEAHRAVGNYSYVWLAKNYVATASFPHIIGMTASPGSDVQTIRDVCTTLFIEDIAVRTEQDPDVQPYVHALAVEIVRIELPPELQAIRARLERCAASKLEEVKRLGYLPAPLHTYNKSSLIAIQAMLHGQMAKGEKDFNILRSISLLAEAMKVHHALDLVETQSLPSLLSYLDKLQQESLTTKVKAVQNLVRDPEFKMAYTLAASALAQHIDHPKRAAVVDFVVQERLQHPDSKVMVFTQYRDMGSQLVKALDERNIRARLFVGQAKKNGTGLQQKAQQAMLTAFREGEFDVLVSSSVGEEGLDIPAVDVVVFYEPIPSVIRKIQRSGRTGRVREGKVVVFMTKGTRDEAYHYVARGKEKRMYRVLDEFKRHLHLSPPPPAAAARMETALLPQLPTIVVDFRERNSPVLKELHDIKDIHVELRQLSAGDYIISDAVLVEYKRTPDFVDSIVDGRLLSQLPALKQYAKPLIIIEGDEDLFSVRRLHPNSIYGMLLTITLSYGIPLLWTRTPKETASLLALLARREDSKEKRPFTFHASKPLTRKEQQEFIVGSLPGIGGALAKPLLEQFGSVLKLLNASEDALREVKLIGEKKAKAIRDVLNAPYEKEK